MKISHISWNLVGLTLPLAMAAVAVPKLLSLLGQERFGILALAWGLIGYAGALDLGIGRATTYLVSRLRAGSVPEVNSIPTVLATAETLTSLAGGVGALLLATAALAGVGNLLTVSEVSSGELLISAVLMAVALPMQALSATYRGINEAYLNFRSISILRILLGVANFGLPLVAALYSNKVYWLVGSIVISRAIALCVYRILARKCISHIPRNEVKFSFDVAKKLARFGGWFTVSSVVNPMVVVADRFIIASAVSAAAISFYVIPYEMVVQSLALVGAITTVAFPYLSRLRVEDPCRAEKVFKKTLLYVLVLMAGVAFFYYFAGSEILKIWLGKSYSEQHSHIVRILSVGLVTYTLGTMCVSWLHAHGRTSSTAKLNLMEFPLHMALIYFGVKFFGIEGAAMAWVARVSLNAMFLFYLVVRINAK